MSRKVMSNASSCEYCEIGEAIRYTEHRIYDVHNCGFGSRIQFRVCQACLDGLRSTGRPFCFAEGDFVDYRGYNTYPGSLLNRSLIT